MTRRFSRHENTRLDDDINEIHGVRSVGECSFICTVKAQECVGFNFKQGPPNMCELSRMPLDVSDVDMGINPTWGHYALIP